MNWNVEQMSDQTGRVAIVTGANSGIGFETAKGLALKGAGVVMACRNQDKGHAAVARILEAQPTAKVTLDALDLSDLSSVRAFAERFLAAHDRLDLLINNAGVMMVPRGETKDGFELQFGTNHLGHFALTGLLIDRLAATDGSRVVSVSSIAHRMGRIDFDNLNAQRKYRRIGAYAQSKLANLMFARELQRRLKSKGIAASSLAAHPGWTNTNLQKGNPSIGMWNPVLAQRPPAGALPTLYAATSDDAVGGQYYGPKGWFELRGAPTRAKIAKQARDEAVAARLWSVSEQLTDVRFLS